jgi:hypothetical protein
MEKKDLKVVPVSRADHIQINGVIFQYWWKDGRPHEIRVSSDEEILTIEHLRKFIVWCDSLPDFKQKE